MAPPASRYVEGDDLVACKPQPVKRRAEPAGKNSLTVQDSRGGLEERLRSFKKAYGATASQQEKQRLLRHFKERKERASNIENGAPVSGSSPTALSKQRSFAVSPSRPTTGKAAGIRIGGSSWDHFPRRPQTAIGFAGRLRPSKSLAEDERHAPLQDNDGRFSSWSWDSGVPGAVSSLGMSSEAGSVHSHDSANVMSDLEQNLKSLGEDSSSPYNNLANNTAEAPQGQSYIQQRVEEVMGALGQSDVSDMEKRPITSVGISCFKEAFADHELSSDASDGGAYPSWENGGSGVEAGVAMVNRRPSDQLATEANPSLSEFLLERASGSLNFLMVGVSESACEQPKLDSPSYQRSEGDMSGFSSPQALEASQATELRQSSQSLTSSLLYERVRPSTSIPSLRNSGLSVSKSVSGNHWSPQSRPGRAFSAPNSRSSSPSRIEVRTRVAFSYEQFALFENGVPIQRERMISRPEPTKTTVQQLKEWRQSERVKAWWYHHQTTVFQQRKMRFKKAALDVRWILQRRRKEKAWHRAMNEEALRRAIAAERIKKAFKTVLTMVKARLRSPAFQATDEQFFKGGSPEQQPRASSGGSPPRNAKEPMRAGARASRASGEEVYRKSDEGKTAVEGAAGSSAAASELVGERRHGSADGLERTVGQGTDATRPASGSDVGAYVPEGSKEAGSSGVVGEASSTSAPRAVRASTTGDRGFAPGKKKNVAFVGAGGRGNENQRSKPGRGKSAGRGTKDAKNENVSWRSTAEDEQKGASRAAWLVPVYKSNNFVPMFHVPQDGPLLTSRRLWASTKSGSDRASSSPSIS